MCSLGELASEVSADGDGGGGGGGGGVSQLKSVSFNGTQCHNLVLRAHKHQL